MACYYPAYCYKAKDIKKDQPIFDYHNDQFRVLNYNKTASFVVNSPPVYHWIFIFVEIPVEVNIPMKIIFLKVWK